MRVAIINRHVSDVVGGSEIQCDLLANGLATKGHSVCYISPTLEVRRTGEHTETVYNVVRTPNNANSILNAIFKKKVDVVYWRYNKNFIYRVSKQLAQNKIPVVFAVSHINDFTKWEWAAANRSFLHKLKRLISGRWQYRGFHFIDYATVLNKDLLQRSPVQNITHISNSMPNKLEPFFWPKPYLLWVANIKSEKRPDVVVRLAEKLLETDVDILMVGKIQDKKFAWLKNKEQLPNNLHYLGEKTIYQVNGLLRGSLFHIHTCLPEGFGNIFIQSWQQGRPSVSLGYDPAGTITKQSLGLVAGDDEKLFLKSVKRLIRDSKLRGELGNNALIYSKKSFSVEKMVSDIEKILLKAYEDKYK